MLKNGTGIGYSALSYQKENYFINGRIATFVLALDDEFYPDGVCFSVLSTNYRAGVSSFCTVYTKLIQENKR